MIGVSILNKGPCIYFTFIFIFDVSCLKVCGNCVQTNIKGILKWTGTKVTQHCGNRVKELKLTIFYGQIYHEVCIVLLKMSESFLESSNGFFNPEFWKIILIISFHHFGWWDTLGILWMFHRRLLEIENKLMIILSAGSTKVILN